MTNPQLAGLQRRHNAAQRLQPLPDGSRDPHFENLPPLPEASLETALAQLAINGTVSQETCRLLWREFPDHKTMIEAYAQAHQGGWA